MGMLTGVGSRIGAGAAAMTMVGALASAAPAAADSIDAGTGDSGFTLAVRPVVSSPSGDSNLATSVGTVYVPPTCWWEPWDRAATFEHYGIDVDDPDAMRKYFDLLISDNRGHSTPARLSYPSANYIDAHSGSEWTWYRLASVDGVNCYDEGYTQRGGVAPDNMGVPGSGTVSVEFLAAQGAPPEPAVDVEDLVTAVWDSASQDLEGPDLDRNPKAHADGVDAATLVNMETWFWVQNVQAALAGDGLIELDVEVPGTGVRASLTASTDGVQVSSPAGAADCSVDQALTQYAPGVAESSACTFPFTEANTGGWPVTATTTWTGTWEGTQANGEQVGGDLETLTPSATSTVPVAESQALVDEVG